MSEPIDLSAHRHDDGATVRERPEPSNAVYARVGDLVLRAAIHGVHRGVQPEEIIREIVQQHNVRLTLGELRLLLATRRPLPDVLRFPTEGERRGTDDHPIATASEVDPS
jgi:hypothetical protein